MFFVDKKQNFNQPLSFTHFAFLFVNRHRDFLLSMTHKDIIYILHILSVNRKYLLLNPLNKYNFKFNSE